MAYIYIYVHIYIYMYMYIEICCVNVFYLLTTLAKICLNVMTLQICFVYITYVCHCCVLMCSKLHVLLYFAVFVGACIWWVSNYFTFAVNTFSHGSVASWNLQQLTKNTSSTVVIWINNAAFSCQLFHL